MGRLLASAATLEGITGMIRDFWPGSAYTVNADTLAIEHLTRDAPTGVRVVKAKGRYRFEMTG